MNFLDALRQALGTLAGSRARSILTLFGVVWGTASVVFLMSWGEGVTQMLDRGFMKTGKNMAVMWAGTVSEEFTPASDRRWLWLNDGPCTRLRPEQTIRLWSWYFVFERTEDGCPIELMVVIDEYTRLCLAIYVAGRIRAKVAIEFLPIS